MERFTDKDIMKSRNSDVEKLPLQELSAEESFDDDDVAHGAKPALSWQVPRAGRRRWAWIASGGLIFIALLSLMRHITIARTTPSLQDEALLDTTLNATLGFQKIFVINLKKATTRKDRILLAADQTGIKVEFIEAITLDEVDRKAVPWTGDELEDIDVDRMGQKTFASWRSHVNAVQAVIDQNLGSALILEDDADWDVRIKDQLRNWALTSRQLVQPTERDHDEYLDPTYFKSNSTQYNLPMPGHLRTTEWDVNDPPEKTLEPSESAYGDLARWDILWLGHCGQRFAHPGSECYKTPLGRVVRHDDETVAETQWFRNSWSAHEYADTYENHTRVTHWSCAQVCNTAYAVSNQGARKLLYDYGVRVFRAMSDAELRFICDGRDPFYEMRTCLSVSPPLFNQYGLTPTGKFSHTANIRLSAQGNLDRLVNGDEPLDWWEDGKDRFSKEKEAKAAQQAWKAQQEAAKKAVKEASKEAYRLDKEEFERIQQEKIEAERLAAEANMWEDDDEITEESIESEIEEEKAAKTSTSTMTQSATSTATTRV